MVIGVSGSCTVYISVRRKFWSLFVLSSFFSSSVLFLMFWIFTSTTSSSCVGFFAQTNQLGLARELWNCIMFLNYMRCWCVEIILALMPQISQKLVLICCIVFDSWLGHVLFFCIKLCPYTFHNFWREYVYLWWDKSDATFLPTKLLCKMWFGISRDLLTLNKMYSNNSY